MIVKHIDSNGIDWYFKVDVARDKIKDYCKVLVKNTQSVKWLAKQDYAQRSLLSRFMLAEAVVISDKQAYSSATVNDYNNAPEEERYATDTASNIELVGNCSEP